MRSIPVGLRIGWASTGTASSNRPFQILPFIPERNPIHRDRDLLGFPIEMLGKRIDFSSRRYRWDASLGMARGWAEVCRLFSSRRSHTSTASFRSHRGSFGRKTFLHLLQETW